MASKHVISMTEGNITKQLLTVAWPLVICDLIQQLYNTVDSYVLARFVGQNSFAALGVAETYVNLFVFILLGACTGISVVLATHFGAKQYELFRRAFFLALTAGGFLTLAFSLAGVFCTKWGLGLINTPLELLEESATFLRIVCGGLICCYIYNLCAAALRAVGNTRIAAIILFGSLLVKSVFSYLLAVIFGLGITGAALSTVVTQIIACLAFYGYAKTFLPELIFTREDMIFDKAELRKIFNYSSMTALQQSSVQIGKVLIQGSINSLGAAHIAAYAAAARLESFVNTFSQSLAASLSLFVAQNIGAKNPVRTKEGFKRARFISSMCGIVTVAIMYGFAPLGISFFIDSVAGDNVALASGVAYLRTVAFFYLICFWGAIYQGYLRGAGILDVQYYGTTGQIAARVIFTWLFIKTMGLVAVAWATGLGWVLITFYHLYYWPKNDLN